MNGYILCLISLIIFFGILIGFAMCDGTHPDTGEPVDECYGLLNCVPSKADTTQETQADSNDQADVDEQAESEPDTHTTTKQSYAPVVRVNEKPCSRPLSIVNVEALKKPMRIYLTIRNSSDRFQSLHGLTLRLLNKDGTLKRQIGFRHVSITYQKRRGETHADSLIVLYRYRKAFEKHQRQPEEKIVSLFPVDYDQGDVFSLMCQDTEISRYPETVPAAPRLQRKVATTWASIKR